MSFIFATTDTEIERDKEKTRGQSNLAKAASNTPHTLHAQDSVAVDVPEIRRQSQNLKVDHVTSPHPL